MFRSVLIAACLMFYGASAQAETILPVSICHKISSTYIPGVDVHGKPVVPAELTGEEGMSITFPPEFRFDITVDIAKAIGLPTPIGTEMPSKIGTVIYNKGVFSFNDQPFSADQATHLRFLCDFLKRTKSLD